MGVALVRPHLERSESQNLGQNHAKSPPVIFITSEQVKAEFELIVILNTTVFRY